MTPQFALEQVAHHWDQMAAGGYEEFNARTVSYGRRFTDALEMIAVTPGAEIQPGCRLIDVGCGTGNGLLIFCERYGCSGVGVDVSQGMLDIARAKLQARSLPVELYQANGEDLTFEDGTFDVGISFEVLEHTPDPARLIKELSRVVRPGGIVIITTPNTLWEPVHWLAGVTGLHHSEGPHRDVSRRQILDFLAAAELRLLAERSAVLVPAGPQPMIRLGQGLEERLPEAIRRVIALRRMFLCACAGPLSDS